MARRSRPINPFYPLLVVVSVVFVVTASAYGVMALRAISPASAGGNHPLLAFLDRHGMLLLMVEVARSGGRVRFGDGDRPLLDRARCRAAANRPPVRSQMTCGRRKAVIIDAGVRACPRNAGDCPLLRGPIGSRSPQEKNRMKVNHYEQAEQAAVPMEGAVGCQMRRLLGPEDGTPTFAMRQFEVAPGRPHSPS